MAFDIIDFQFRLLENDIQTTRADMVRLSALVDETVQEAIAEAIKNYKRESDPRSDHEKLVDFARNDGIIKDLLLQDKWINAIKEIRSRGDSVIDHQPSLKEAKDVVDYIRGVI